MFPAVKLDLSACRTDREEAHISHLWDTRKNPGSIRTPTFAVVLQDCGRNGHFQRVRYYSGVPIYSRAFKGLCDFTWLSYHVPAIEQYFLGLMMVGSEDMRLVVETILKC